MTTLFPLISLALGGAALLWLLVEFWGIEPAYADRMLILIAAGWIVYRAWPQWRVAPVRTCWWGLIPLLIGAIVAPPVWNLVAQVGTRTVLIWWHALALILLTGGYLLLCWGGECFRLLLFPLIFTLFALPLPQRVHDAVQGQLQDRTTALAARILSVSGVSVERQGFQLHLPSGDLEVVEACSGIRSVTALSAISALVAYFRGFRFFPGLIFILLTFPVIGLCNVFRIVGTGLLQEGFGHTFVQGFTHDLLGIVAVLVGLGLILATSKVFPVSPNYHRGTADAPHPADRPRFEFVVGFLLATTLGAALVCYQTGTSDRAKQTEQVRLDLVPLDLGNWSGEDRELADAVRMQLAPERFLRRHYGTSLGQEAEVWVLYWSSMRGMRGYHHPDLCLPNHGWNFSGQDNVKLSLSGVTVPLTVRFYRQGNREQMVCYWNQEGSRVWTPEDEERLLQSDSLGLIGERLFRSRPPESGRLAFLVAAELGGNRNYSVRSVLVLTAELAENVYLHCPWAKP